MLNFQLSTVHSRLKRGFTLIELLVVIAILGILIAIVSSSFLTAQKQSRDSKRKTDLEQIRQALETYRSVNNQYPDTANWESALTGGGYINTIPVDPGNGGYDYQYVSSTEYNLCAGLEITPAVPDSCSLDCGSLTCNYLVQNP